MVETRENQSGHDPHVRGKRMAGDREDRQPRRWLREAGTKAGVRPAAVTQPSNRTPIIPTFWKAMLAGPLEPVRRLPTAAAGAAGPVSLPVPTCISSDTAPASPRLPASSAAPHAEGRLAPAYRTDTPLGHPQPPPPQLSAHPLPHQAAETGGVT